jgi:predicted kinase
MKKLYLVRGLPNSGKTTLAKELTNYNTSSDDFMIDENGNYCFESNRLRETHASCQYQVEEWMLKDHIKRISVANTFTQEWEMEPYKELARAYEFDICVMTVQGGNHKKKNEHNVPFDAIKRMAERFEDVI